LAKPEKLLKAGGKNVVTPKVVIIFRAYGISPK
jgi:hypothetical protein